MSAPWRADGASCWPRISRRIGCAGPGVAARRWKKNSASHSPHPGTDATRHGGRPDGWAEMDASHHRADWLRRCSARHWLRLPIMILFHIPVQLWMYTIMRTAQFHSSEIRRALEGRTVCTFEELARALGTDARMTVFRKLAELSYL